MPGNFSGSILGGRWSDRTLARLKAQNGDKSSPEVRLPSLFLTDRPINPLMELNVQMRLESAKIAMIFLPPSIVGYAWVCEKQVHISAVAVMLFLSGFFTMYVNIFPCFLTCIELTMAVDGYIRAC